MGRDNGKRQEDSDEKSRACNRERRGAGTMARGKTTVMSRAG